MRLCGMPLWHTQKTGEYDTRLKAIKELYTGKPGYETDYDSKAERELVADLIGDYVFSDPEFVRNLSVSNRNLFQKLYDEIKYLAKVATAGSKEARALEKVKKTFKDVYRDTKNTAPQDGVKYSIKKTSKISYEEQLALIENNKLNGSNSLYAGEPSIELQNAGLSDAPFFVMNQGDYRKSRRHSAKNKKYSAHSVPFAFFQKMPAYLNESPLLIDNGKKVTILTLFKMQDTKGKASVVIAGVVRDQSMDDDTVNQIKSAYPLDDCAAQIANAAENGRLVVINENKAKQILASIGVQPSEQSRILSLAKERISQESINVNRKLSLSEDGGGASVIGDNVYGHDVAVESREETVPAAKRSKVDYSKVAPTKENIAAMGQEKAAQSEDGMQTLIRGLDKIRIFPNDTVVFTIFLW